MTEPTERLPEPTDETPPKKQKIVDPIENLVYRGGYQGDPREIVENPAVAPQMLNEPGDLRDDLLEED